MCGFNFASSNSNSSTTATVTKAAKPDTLVDLCVDYIRKNKTIFTSDKLSKLPTELVEKINPAPAPTSTPSLRVHV